MLPNINPQIFIVKNFNKTLTNYDLTFEFRIYFKTKNPKKFSGFKFIEKYY